MQASFSTLKRESDLLLVTAGANIGEAVTAISATPRRPKERLLSGWGWASLLTAGASVVVVTWFVVHAPI